MIHNWHDISIFLAVSRLGSTNAAGKALGINSSTVSRRIEVLEHGLNLVLFERDTRGFHLTSDGEALFREATQVELKVTTLEKRASHLLRSGTGTLRLTAPDSVFTDILNPILAEFRATHTRVRFECLSTDDTLDLETGAADIAFRGAAIDPELNAITRSLATFNWTVFASRSWKKRPRSWDELKEYPCAVFAGRMRELGPHRK